MLQSGLEMHEPQKRLWYAVSTPTTTKTKKYLHKNLSSKLWLSNG